MTPKEKAKELINEFIEVVTEGNFPSVKAKECALIAVNEILSFINKNDIDVWNRDILTYWQEVKQEIEKL